MKQGRKKIEKEEAGSKKAGDDDSGTFKLDSDMIGGNPNGIDAIKALQMIAGGSAFWYSSGLFSVISCM